jgi:hypothetical protein
MAVAVERHMAIILRPICRTGSSADGDILPEKAACSSMHYVTESSQFFSIGTYP